MADKNTNDKKTSDKNAYKFSPSDVKASEEFSLDFQPNILDLYDVQTYHFKLFITSIENAASGDILNKANQVIIAESGVSDLVIDKVELNGIAGPSVESGTGTQTTLKFEIVEPAGAGLIDKIFYESLSLGIGNWMVMPLYLQLEFRGRDPETGSAGIDGSPNGIGGLRWVWPLKIGTMKANVTKVGTRYEFDAVMYNELAQSNSYFSIQHNVVLTGLDTFGKAMEVLKKKLNDDQYEKLIDNYGIPDTYNIIVDDELKNVQLVNPQDTKNTSRGADYVDLSKKTATFNSGTSIDKIVDALLGSSAEFAKKMQNADTPNSTPKTEKQEKEQMKKLWRVVTETRPIAYDVVRQNNANAITIFIVKYDLGVMDVTPAQTGQTADAKEAERRRFVEYYNKGIMRKIYNYFFTGLNDQIINLDLNMNYSFAQTVARFGGIYYDQASNSKGISQEDNAKNEKALTEQMRQTLSFVNNAKPTDNVDAKIAEMRKALDNTVILDGRLKDKYKILLDHAKPTGREAFTSQLATSNGMILGRTEYTDEQLAKARSDAKAIGAQAAPDTGLTFVSDVIMKSSVRDKAFAAGKMLQPGKLRPVVFHEGVQERTLATGTDPRNDASRQRVSSIFASALYSSVDATLANIKMTIKGDPFWLFPRSIGQKVDKFEYKSDNPAKGIEEIKNSHKKNPNAVNLFGTDNFIVLRMRTPRIFDQTNPVEDPFTEVEMFSGVYKVVSLISKFEMGKFTQELNCILDPVINLTDFLEQVERAMGKKQEQKIDKPTPSPIPITAVKNTPEWKYPGGIIDEGPVTSIIKPNPTVQKKFDANGYIQRNSG